MVSHVNSVAGLKNSPYRGMSIRNCAACTAAGAVNLSLGTSEISSGHVAESLGKGDNVTTMGTDTKAQIVNIRDFVRGKTGRETDETSYELPLDAAEDWMRAKPNKTVFAVLASGNVPHDSEAKCHWLNAIVAGGRIRYFDFQPMRHSTKGGDFVGHKNPATSTRPFVGVITQSQFGANHKQMHSSVQAGIFDGSVKLTVIAFMTR